MGKWTGKPMDLGVFMDDGKMGITIFRGKFFKENDGKLI